MKKLVFSTSAAIYGDNPVVPKVETMLPEPKSPYAITKLDGEFYCKMFADEGRLPTACLRYFNVFGPRQDPKSQYAAAVPIFIDRAVKNQPITIYGDGEQTRDFIYVKDIVAANVFFATQSPATGVFNVAYGQRITINELAETICRSAVSSSTIQYAPERTTTPQPRKCASRSATNAAGKSMRPCPSSANSYPLLVAAFFTSFKCRNKIRRPYLRMQAAGSPPPCA